MQIEKIAADNLAAIFLLPVIACIFRFAEF